MSKVLVKVSLSNYIISTTQHSYLNHGGSAFMPLLWPLVHAKGGGFSQTQGHLNVISANVFWNKFIQIVCQTWLHLLTAPCRS